MNTNRANQNASMNKNVNFGTKLEGFKDFLEPFIGKEIPKDHPLIARLVELAQDGRNRVLRYNVPTRYERVHDTDTWSGRRFTSRENFYIEPKLGLIPEFNDAIGLKRKNAYLRLLNADTPRAISGFEKSIEPLGGFESPDFYLWTFHDTPNRGLATDAEKEWKYKYLREKSANLIANGLFEALKPENIASQEAKTLKDLDKAYTHELLEARKPFREMRERVYAKRAQIVAAEAQTKARTEGQARLGQLNELGIG